jgi:uncharacterized membrane protein YqjE
MTTDPNKSTGSLLSDALTHVSSLVRSEVDLARAEVNENLKSAGAAIGLIVGVAFALIAYVMVNKGTNALKLSSLAPTRTTKNVKRDAQAVKEVYDDK